MTILVNRGINLNFNYLLLALIYNIPGNSFFYNKKGCRLFCVCGDEKTVVSFLLSGDMFKVLERGLIFGSFDMHYIEFNHWEKKYVKRLRPSWYSRAHMCIQFKFTEMSIIHDSGNPSISVCATFFKSFYININMHF